MGFGITCAKYTVFIVNLIFVIIGLGIAGVGIIIQTRAVDYYDLFKELEIFSIPIILIVAGSTIFVISFFACCGAVAENRCMLFTFSTLLLVVLVLEIGIGAFAYAKKDVIDGIVEENLNKTMQRIKDNDVYYTPWDKLQRQFKCCGVLSPNDWESVTGQSLSVPSSCCQIYSKGSSSCSKNDAYQLGCKKALVDYLVQYSYIILGIGLGIAAVELLAIVFACCLFSAFRKPHHHSQSRVAPNN